MKLHSLTALLSLLSLSACVSMTPPPAEKLAALPVITLGETPPQGDFILKLPAGMAIPGQVDVKGTALSLTASQALQVSLPQDLYIHGPWLSEDGKKWVRGDTLFAVHVKMRLPSDQHPKPAELLVTVDRKN